MRSKTSNRVTFRVLSVCMLLLAAGIVAASPKREFRATWIATVSNIDWPSTKVTTTGSTTQINQQKNQLIAILDTLAAGNIHAVCLQIRPASDAFYPSSLSPWSAYLTGTRGKNPGYDPLAFAVQEAHKRGMELHAWFNPFRYEVTSARYGTVDLRASHPDWIIEYNNGSFSGSILDPGVPSVRQYLKQVIGELIANYDIDGIIADDYFYPYGGTTTEDAASKAAYKPSNMSDGDWRRQNVNQTIEGIYDTIQAAKPWVRFGMAPFGIWTTQTAVALKNGITLPSGISGLDDYSVQFCDPVAWAKGGYVDYLSPQLYWPTYQIAQDYDVLCRWWGQQVCKHFSDLLPDGKQVHLYVSQNDYSDWVSVSEEGLQVDANRQYCPFDAPGSIFYNTSYYKSKGLVPGMKSTKFQYKSLPPAMSWKAAPVLAAPTGLSLTGKTLTWQHPAADRFSIYAFPKGTNAVTALSSSTYLQGMCYGRQFTLTGVQNLSNMTIAVCALDRYGNEYEAAFYNYQPAQPATAEEGTMTMELLWQKTQAQTGFMGTGNENRSIAAYGDEVFVADGANSKYYIVNAATGARKQTVDLPEEYFAWHNLRITSDGTLLLGNSATGSNYQTFYTAPLGSGTTETLSAFNNTGFGRTDYFYTYGDFDETGYALMLSNVNNKVLYVPYGNGDLGASTVISHGDLPVGTSAKAIPADESTFFTSVAGTPVMRHRLSDGAATGSWGSVRPAAVNVSGMAYFKVRGHEYLLAPSDIYGGFETFEITDGLSAATKLFNATPALGSNSNAAFTVDFAVRQTGDDTYVYVRD